VATSLCCPGRVSVLTGKHAHLTGVYDNQPTQDFQERHRTFADHLQQAGWRTAFIGKWHLPNPGAAPRPGFDRWVSFEDQGEYYDQKLNVDGQEVLSRGHNTDVLTGYAVAFVEEPREEPFLLFLSLKNCHSPHHPPARHRGRLAEAPIRLPESFHDDPDLLPGRYREARLARRNRGAHPHPELYLEEVRRYWELVLGVDECVGQLLAALERSGQLDRTLFVFTSDNGYLLGEHGLIQKGLGYELALRVPLLMRWPERLPAGTRSQALALNLDLFPTILTACGLPLPEDLQGQDLLPAALGPPPGWRTEYLFLAPWFREDGTPQELGLSGGRWKYIRFRGRGIEEALFDLESDPDERHNRAGDPELAHQLAGARARLRARMRELAVPLEWFEAPAAAKR
jgi:N-acetylglucosamine-6-sulfatase